MKCERARNLIHAELDGEINAEQQKLLHAHVETCESCGLMRAQWRAMERGFDWLAEQSETCAQAPATASTIIRPSWLWRAAGAAVSATQCELGLEKGLRQGEDDQERHQLLDERRIVGKDAGHHDNDLGEGRWLGLHATRTVTSGPRTR